MCWGGSGAGGGRLERTPWSPAMTASPTPTHSIGLWGGRGPLEVSEGVKILQIQAVGATRCPVIQSAYLLPLQGPAPSLLSHSSGQQALPNRPGLGALVVNLSSDARPATPPGVLLDPPWAGRNYTPPHRGCCLLSLPGTFGTLNAPLGCRVCVPTLSVTSFFGSGQLF